MSTEEEILVTEQQAKNAHALILVAVAVVILAVASTLTTVALWTRSNDLKNIDRNIDAQINQLESAFCQILLVYQIVPPDTAYGKAIAQQAAGLAGQFHCLTGNT